MALTKQQKNDIVKEVSDLMSNSKLTVVAKYQGTSVKAMQALRRQAKEGQTVVKVVKNRLVIKAIAANDVLKDVDTGALEGQLLYAFNSEDEVAPAQALANFAKTNPTIEFVGAINAEGRFLAADEVKTLSTLPSKPQLIADVIATLSSPVNDVMGALSSNLHGLLDAIEANAS
ncbi:50S ribosomal protein L10 [Candidatus Saccharibacteria bacterium]|nr:50S ribosomal protein L10 [Candidatus Saccharibacteria bacterium]